MVLVVYSHDSDQILHPSEHVGGSKECRLSILLLLYPSGKNCLTSWSGMADSINGILQTPTLTAEQRKHFSDSLKGKEKELLEKKQHFEVCGFLLVK